MGKEQLRNRAGKGGGQSLLLDIYDRLYKHFGPRNWWPGDSPTEVIIGAILTQSVSWRNVEKAISNLKGAGLLNFSDIDRVDTEELAGHVVPTRYYRQKARRLKAFARYLAESYGGRLEDMFQRDTAALRRELLALSGIGPETADSILLYACEKPAFVVDAYTRRICSRLGLVEPDASYKDVQGLFEKQLPVDIPLFNEYHALIVALGHHLCLNQKPRCGECPLAELCPVGKGQRTKD